MEAAEPLVCSLRQVWSAGRSQLQANAAPGQTAYAFPPNHATDVMNSAEEELGLILLLMQHYKLLFINAELSERRQCTPRACRGRRSEERVLNEEALQLQTSLVGDGLRFTVF